jgi:hypothetical protein
MNMSESKCTHSSDEARSESYLLDVVYVFAGSATRRPTSPLAHAVLSVISQVVSVTLFVLVVGRASRGVRFMVDAVLLS